MKLCWDNIDGFKFTKNGYVYNKGSTYTLIERCSFCGSPCLVDNKIIKINNEPCCSQSCTKKLKTLHNFNKHIRNKKYNMLTILEISDREKNGALKYKCICACGNHTIVNSHNLKKGLVKSCGCKQRKWAGNVNYKNGVTKKNIALYDTFSERLYFEEVSYEERYNQKILLVRCLYCNKWFSPTPREIYKRCDSINNINLGANNFYCSDGCKEACPVFNQQKYPKGFKSGNTASSREMQPELRKMVLERDNWTCQYGSCGKTVEDCSIHCHHMEGIMINPIESVDIDMCISFCKKHHKKVHKEKDCRYVDLQCKKE